MKELTAPVIKMLEKALAAKNPRVYIECALSVLMEMAIEKAEDIEQLPTPKAKGRVKPPKVEEDTFKVVADGEILVKMTNENDDEIDTLKEILVDGKQTTYGEAVGKPFKTIKIL